VVRVHFRLDRRGVEPTRLRRFAEYHELEARSRAARAKGILLDRAQSMRTAPSRCLASTRAPTAHTHRHGRDRTAPADPLGRKVG
jgi:hypothetical protein